MVKLMVYSGLLCSSILTAQNIEFHQVRKLGAGVNSRCEETMPMVSPNGERLYYVRVACVDNTGGAFAGSDTWVSTWDKASRQWRKSDNKNFHNDKFNNAIVGMSNDEQKLYFLNTNPSKKVRGVYSIKRNGHTWSKPVLIPIPFLDTDKFLGLYISPDFDLMIVSMEGHDSLGLEDLYISMRDENNEWTELLHLGHVVNTTGYEISPFLSADKKRLYFSSNGHQGLGDADIFYSDRLDDSWQSWSEPVNLGDKVNSKNFDAYFFIRDNTAYFSSNRESQFADIYQASLKVKEDSTQRKIDTIVAEAQAILNALQVHPTASMKTITSDPVFIDFEYNSAVLNSTSMNQLNLVARKLKNLGLNEITLVAHFSDHTSETQGDQLWHRRLNAVKTYFEQISLSEMKINLELKKHIPKDWNKTTGFVEVRF